MKNVPDPTGQPSRRPAVGVSAAPPGTASDPGWLTRLFGPLGRYRPGWLRRDLAAGFHNCDRLTTPHWAHLPDACTPEERLLGDLRLDGKVVFDVGAHTGAYSLFFSRQVGPQGLVVAFEPCPRTFARLRRNVEINRIRNVRPLALALGRETGPRAIYMLPGMSSTASLAPEARTRLRRRVAVVAVEPMDALCARLSLPAPDFVKIDVEGLELEVLAGADHILRECHPDLLIEIHGAGTRGRQDQADRVATLLTRLGYRLIHVESQCAVSPGCAAVATAGHLYGHCAPRLAPQPI